MRASSNAPSGTPPGRAESAAAPAVAPAAAPKVLSPPVEPHSAPPPAGGAEGGHRGPRPPRAGGGAATGAAKKVAPAPAPASTPKGSARDGRHFVAAVGAPPAAAERTDAAGGGLGVPSGGSSTLDDGTAQRPSRGESVDAARQTAGSRADRAAAEAGTETEAEAETETTAEAETETTAVAGGASGAPLESTEALSEVLPRLALGSGVCHIQTSTDADANGSAPREEPAAETESAGAVPNVPQRDGVPVADARTTAAAAAADRRRMEALRAKRRRIESEVRSGRRLIHHPRRDAERGGGDDEERGAEEERHSRGGALSPGRREVLRARMPRRCEPHRQLHILPQRVLGLLTFPIFLILVAGEGPSVVNFVHSGATLLSGGLADCPTPLDETCIGGMAIVSAYMRHHIDTTGEPVLFIPQCDRTSPFVQMHPMTWTVNRLILHEHFDWPVFRSSLSLLTSSRDLAYLRTLDMPLLITNALIPPSNSWYDYTKLVHYDAQSRLAIMYVLSDSQPNSWPGIDSALRRLDRVADENEGVTGKDRWVPLVVYSDHLGFEEFLAAVSAHENPPQIVLTTTGPDAVWKYNKTVMGAGPWVGRGDESTKRNHRFRILLDEANSVTDVALVVEDLEALPNALKDERYLEDQDFLRGLADAAAVNDPIVGTSGEMPLTRVDSTRMCMAGECIIGNLFTDAYKWKAGADVAFVPSGGLRGPGWPAGDVQVSDLWHALPFENTLCTGQMSGVTMFKLLNFSTATATFQSTYTDMGDRLVQVSGLRYTYNTRLNNSRLIAVEVWDSVAEAYEPLERLRLYSFVTDSFMCNVFDPFPSFFGSTEIEGEVPGVVGDFLAQNVVGAYLTQLGRPYNTTKQGRLRNDTSAFSYLVLVHTKGECPANTYWTDPIKTCSPCRAHSVDGLHVSFSDEIIELKTEHSTKASSRVILTNREVLDVTVSLKNRPGWVEITYDMTNSSSNELLEGEDVLLVAGESIALEFAARTEQLEAGTALGTVSFGVFDAAQENPACSKVLGEVSSDVFVRVAPPPHLNQLSSGIRGAGLALMGIIALSSVSFSAWVFAYRRIRVVRASQPMFLQLICLGTLVMGSGIIPLSIDDGVASEQGCNMACMSFPWLISMGFTISFSALFSKIWRINQLIYSSLRFQKVKLTEKDVLAPFCVLFVLNFATLLAWTLADPLRWVRIPVDGDDDDLSNTYGTCTTGNSASIAFLVVILVINVGALFLACLQAYHARHFSVEYSESKYIGMAMFGWLQVVIVGIPVLFLVSENPTASFFLQSALIFVLCMSTLLLIFVPKLLIFRKRNEQCMGVGMSQQALAFVEGALEGVPEEETAEAGLGISHPGSIHNDVVRDLRTKLTESQEKTCLLEAQLRGKEQSMAAALRDLKDLREQLEKSRETLPP